MVLKDRVQWKVFGSKREEMAGVCRKLHDDDDDDDDELHGLYCSPNIIPVILKKRIRGVRLVAQEGQKCIQDFGGQT
jgi:hypothetical protein